MAQLLLPPLALPLGAAADAPRLSRRCRPRPPPGPPPLLPQCRRALRPPPARPRMQRPAAAARRRAASSALPRAAVSPEGIAALLRADASLARRTAVALDEQTAAEWSAARAEAESKAAAASASVARPAGRQYRQLFVRTAVPFVGFGFFDNVIMLTVGEVVDSTVCVAFGLSTLAAAGIGQMASDSMGITLQGLIERFADNLGLPDPCLSREQHHLSSVKWVVLVSRIVGIILGCLLGMFPLLLMPGRPPEHLVDRIAESLPRKLRQEFMAHVETVKLQPGEMLIERGQMSQNVYLVQSGEVQVIGRDRHGYPFTVCTIGPGHAFGEPELYNPAAVDLVARTDVVVQRISKAAFLKLISEEGREVLESARSPESKVYLSSQGFGRSSGDPDDTFSLWSAQKHTGKTKFFATLTDAEKCEVLRLTNLEEAKHFKGEKHEGKVRFFATLPETQKRDALTLWQQLRNERDLQVAAPSAAAAAAAAAAAQAEPER
eukprot:TRINITY_DN3584_c0_g2_i1.p1 TRINITY_DN3584_c0_g2~~TRINITY_DN3584_c0_g2_i1.p1  ORF type:complete len:492 (+),score=186.95 TRINITY_DN3584_c0_g2_i1:75-1550(+)